MITVQCVWTRNLACGLPGLGHLGQGKEGRVAPGKSWSRALLHGLAQDRDYEGTKVGLVGFYHYGVPFVCFLALFNPTT